MPKPSARDRILDAYVKFLIDHGPAAVTLEAVAAEAGVSKGGLLYHFGSKDALLDGLLDRVDELTTRDLEEARNAPEGLIRFYLRTSATDASMDNPLHRATLATFRLMGHDPKVLTASKRYEARWREALAEHVDDPLTADLIAVVGDGLYLRGTLGEDSTALLSSLDEVLDRLGAGQRTHP
ncbi:TetR/AcrR family transcriptional regulator [Amycolatopsis anabasis]|uniref:TetR/AcrR family transcriptional regulator n=1 Tax=Amycolatopsis anabasis TaxID=1840409 RepID=UPI00131D4D47|nr:TetR/AcrR family transcriptional regulator [Amycolatopsis anabasis]